LRSRCPPEFKVDEIPDPIKIETAYGAYMAEWKVKGNQRDGFFFVRQVGSHQRFRHGDGAFRSYKIIYSGTMVPGELR
jgi:hypothetical protein